MAIRKNSGMSSSFDGDGSQRRRREGSAGGFRWQKGDATPRPRNLRGGGAFEAPHCRERATPVALIVCVIHKDAPPAWRAPGKDQSAASAATRSDSTVTPLSSIEPTSWRAAASFQA